MSRIVPLVSRTLAILAGLLLASAPVLAAPDLGELEERIERNAKDPFEQDQRERAIRDLAKIGSVKAVKLLIPLYDDPFEHLADRCTSALIEMLRGPEGEAVTTWLREKGLRERSGAFRAGVWQALAVAGQDAAFHAGPGKEKDEAVLRAYARGALRTESFLEDPKAIKQYVDRLKKVKTPATADAMLEALALHPSPETSLEVLEAYAAKPGVHQAGALLALARHPAHETVRSAVRDAARFATLADPRARVALLEDTPVSTADVGQGDGSAHPGALWAGLADDDWRVRAAAVQAILRHWDPALLPALIDRLAEEPKGRIREDIGRALQTLSGKTMALDADLWRAWLKAQGDAWKPARRPRLEGGRIPFADHGSGADLEEGTVAFFDLPLYSKRILFLFDLSGSMRNEANDGSDVTKLQLVVDEVTETLAGLPDDVRFDLAVYRYPSEFPPRPKLTRAFGSLELRSKKTRKKALAWLGQQEAKGWGAFMEPLESAVALEDVDTIILLSDGRPSRGRLDRDFRILQEFPHSNRLRFTAVHTVLIGTKGADRKFMASLARITGGRLREVSGR